MGLLNNSLQKPLNASDEPRTIKGKECSKKFVQQGRSPFDARSVLSVREHGKRARTPLAAFFNIPSCLNKPIQNTHGEHKSKYQDKNILPYQTRLDSCQHLTHIGSLVTKIFYHLFDPQLIDSMR